MCNALRKARWLLLFLVAWLLVGCGERYKPQGDALAKRVFAVLVQQKVCTDLNDCSQKELVFGEDGDQVNIHIYGISDNGVIAAVVSMTVSEGLQITNGIPIEMKFYPKPKKEYLGFNSIVSRPVTTVRIQ